MTVYKHRITGLEIETDNPTEAVNLQAEGFLNPEAYKSYIKAQAEPETVQAEPAPTEEADQPTAPTANRRK